jgi:Flp pilus assembly protein TadB
VRSTRTDLPPGEARRSVLARWLVGSARSGHYARVPDAPEDHPPVAAPRHLGGPTVEPRFHRMRQRRARGTRAAINWADHLRPWLTVAFGILFLCFWVVELVTSSVTWHWVIGAVAATAFAVVVGLLVRWFRRPVDPESLERLRATRESSRLVSRQADAACSTTF